MSGLFCVTAFRTRECLPCDACGIYPSALCSGNNLLTQTVPAAKPENLILSVRPSTENVGGLFYPIHPIQRRSCAIPKQKTIPELKAEIAANERQLTQLRHKQQQLENRRSYYEKGDRRKRAHRLITRGAAIESVAPLAKILTETEFYAFAEKALALPEVKALLMEAVNEHNRAEYEGRF